MSKHEFLGNWKNDDPHRREEDARPYRQIALDFGDNGEVDAEQALMPRRPRYEGDDCG